MVPPEGVDAGPAPGSDEHVAAVVQGLRRRYRDNVVQLFNRLLVALIIVGGLATVLASSGHAGTTAITCVGVGALVMALSLAHYALRVRRLRRHPAEVIARYEKRLSRMSGSSRG